VTAPTPAAAAAVIAAAILDHLPIRHRHKAQRAAQAAVADLTASGWRIVPILRAAPDARTTPGQPNQPRPTPTV